MTEISNPAKGVIPASSLLLIFLTIGGVMLNEKPFKPSRPFEQDVERLETHIEQDVSMPQWDDPFKETALDVQEAHGDSATSRLWCKTSSHRLSNLRSDITKRVNNSPQAQFHVLLVLTASGFMYNAIELRRRQRTALALALLEDNYIPDKPGRISYLIYPEIGLGDKGLRAGNRAILMPYEWFSKKNSTTLVLWAQGEDIFTETHIREIGVEVIVNSIIDSEHKESTRISILGPSNSPELHKLLESDVATRRKAVLSDREKLQREKARSHLPYIQGSPWGDEGCEVQIADATDASMINTSPAVSEQNDLQSDQHLSEIIRSPAYSDPQEDSTFILDGDLAGVARFLIKASQVLSSEEELEQNAIYYLDDYPESELESAIKNCISFDHDTELISNCLQELEVDDSDPEWYETVAQVFEPRRFVAEKHDVYNSTSNRVEKDYAAFVIMSDAYLDNSWATEWSEDKEIGVLANCATPNQDKLAENLARTTLYESDSEWATTLSRLFFGGYCKMTPGITVGDEEAIPQPVSTPEQQETIFWTLADMKIFSPRATVDNQTLFGQEEGPQQLVRMIANDLNVTEELVSELVRRGVDLCTSETFIALLLEGDSVYGTSYEDTLTRTIESQRKIDCPNAVPADTMPIIEKSIFFSQAEGEKSGSGGQSGSNNSSAFAGDALGMLNASQSQSLELPTGAHQLDYIRRLAKTLSRERRDITAIGIVGTNVYDKQLIIEALRTYLPGTLIFTTDADAFYEDPSFYRYNQNLLVASAYGLSLGNDSPFETNVEFRDNYQTAFYVAARVALSGQEYDPVDLPIKLFELGRSGLIDITPVSSLEWTEIDWENLVFQLPFLFAPVLLLQVFLLSNRRKVPVDSGVKSHQARRRSLNYLLVLGAVVIIAMLLGLIRWVLNPSFEPFYVFEGISAAPTVVLRVSAALFSLSLIVFIAVRMTANQQELTKYFGFPDEDMKKDEEKQEKKKGDKKSRIQRLTELVKGRLHAISIPDWEAKLARQVSRSHRINDSQWEPPTAAEIWHRYRQLGEFWPRVSRIVLPLIILIGLIYLIAYGRYPQPHLVRYDTFFDYSVFGLLQFNGFQLITFVSVTFSTIAVLLAGDALRLSATFVKWHEFDFVNWQQRPDRSIYRNLNEFTSNRLASVEVIMRRTEVMRQIIILPFVVLFLQIAARSNLFEGWTWNPGVVTIYMGFAIYLFYRSSRLQQAANRARKNILIDLDRETSKLRIAAAVARQDPKKSAEVSLIEKYLVSTHEVVVFISELQRGLFRPLMDHPLFQAIAWPSTGLGILALLQALL